jgi:hypothetical protein
MESERLMETLIKSFCEPFEIGETVVWTSKMLLQEGF